MSPTVNDNIGAANCLVNERQKVSPEGSFYILRDPLMMGLDQRARSRNKAPELMRYTVITMIVTDWWTLSVMSDW